MTIDEVDQALAEWESRLRRIDRNLVALQLDPVHTRLEQSGEAGLDGLTRERVLPALNAMQELFARRGLLYDLLGRASNLRAGINPRRPAETLREIEGLLRGPSITVPAVETPLGRRSLLDTDAEMVTPDQLLAAMVASFEAARDVVAAVDQAWKRLEPECRRAGAEADRLQALAAGLGVDAGAALTAVRAQLETVEARVSRDPLGASRTLTTGVFERLGQLDQWLLGLRRQRDRLRADLERARSLLAGLRAAGGRATTALDRCRRELVLDRPLPELDGRGRTEGLAEWLATLQSTAGAGRWAAAGVGMERWLAAAREALAEVESAERTSQGLLDQKEELLGRLGARRQQARVQEARGRALDPGLEQVAARAEALLHQVPTPLSEAAALVADYEAGLRKLG